MPKAKENDSGHLTVATDGKNIWQEMKKTEKKANRQTERVGLGEGEEAA